MKPKKYEIDSFEKLCNLVNEENAQNLATDLAGWLLYYNQVMTETRKNHPEETKGLTNSQIAEASFIWIDDNKHELKGVKITDSHTGEVTYNSFEKDENI